MEAVCLKWGCSEDSGSGLLSTRWDMSLVTIILSDFLKVAALLINYVRLWLDD